jgi:hypothetical protein
VASLKLNDLRRYAIQTRNIVHYHDAEGRAVVLNQKGILEIPGIAGSPGYNVEDVFACAVEFRLEPWSSSYGESRVKAPTTLTPEQMAAEVEKILPASARAGHEEEE